MVACGDLGAELPLEDVLKALSLLKQSLRQLDVVYHHTLLLLTLQSCSSA
jgi:pyruvate kinase